MADNGFLNGRWNAHETAQAEVFYGMRCGIGNVVQRVRSRYDAQGNRSSSSSGGRSVPRWMAWEWS